MSGQENTLGGMLSDPERVRLLEEAKAIWPNAQLSENGEIYIPVAATFNHAVGSDGDLRRVARRRKPSLDELPELVEKAKAVITFHGGTPSRPAATRQRIDEMSYSYGVLWGIACALDCSLREVLDRFSK